MSETAGALNAAREKTQKIKTEALDLINTMEKFLTLIEECAEKEKDLKSYIANAKDRLNYAKGYING